MRGGSGGIFNIFNPHLCALARTQHEETPSGGMRAPLSFRRTTTWRVASLCLSYAGAVYRLPHIYRSIAGEAFRFVSFRSSPNNFSATRETHPPSLFPPFSSSLSPSFAPSPFSVSLCSSFISTPDICPDCNCRGLFPTRFPR